MKWEKSHKDYLISAGLSTFQVLVILVFLMTRNNAKDDSSVILILALLGLLVSAIYFWCRATKKYIDYAIEEKGKEQQVINIAIEEKIKQLKIKETEE